MKRLRCNDGYAFIDETQSSSDDDNALMRMCQKRARTYAFVSGAGEEWASGVCSVFVLLAVAAVGIMWTTRTRNANGGGTIKIYLGVPTFLFVAVPLYFVVNDMCKRQYWRRMHRYDNPNIGSDQ
jgi:hypothetical protein